MTLKEKILKQTVIMSKDRKLIVQSSGRDRMVALVDGSRSKTTIYKSAKAVISQAENWRFTIEAREHLTKNYPSLLTASGGLDWDNIKELFEPVTIEELIK